MNYKIYSFVNDDLNPDIKNYQKKIFNKFNISLNQIIWKKNYKKYGYVVLDDGSHYYNDHPYFLEHTIKNENSDYLIFFDVDCIPTTYYFLDRLLNEISDKNTLSGAIQSNSRFGTYMSAWFVGFHRNLYFECGCPSITTINTDPFLLFTKSCIDNNKKINYWMPTHVERPPYGITYENMIYHEMQIRNQSNHDTFINKCKKILEEQ